MKISGETILEKPKHVIWREVDNEGILLNVNDGFYYGINSVGLGLWKEFDGKQTLTQAASQVEQSYRVTKDRALKDAVRWASHLVQRKLLSTAR